jgi:hypothetical protein
MKGTVALSDLPSPYKKSQPARELPNADESGLQESPRTKQKLPAQPKTEKTKIKTIFTNKKPNKKRISKQVKLGCQSSTED